MPATDEAIDLHTIPEIREMIDRWAERGFLRIPRLGSKVVIEDRQVSHCDSVRLTSQFERRSVSRECAPYHGGPIDDRGRPPDRWDIPVRRPTGFEDRNEHVTIPHTDTVETCGDCSGDGRVRCSKCHGRGRVDCSWCHGRGYRNRRRTRQSSDGFTEWETVRESCTCSGGQVDCSRCDGRGRVSCPTCDEAGRVRWFEQLTVTFDAVHRQEVVQTSGMPERLVLAEEGRELLEVEGERVSDVESLGGDTDTRVREMLEEAASLGADERLLFQRLTVERIPVHKIRCVLPGRKQFDLWIYGPENKVHAPNSPWRLWLILGVLSVVAVAALGVFALM